MGIDFSVYNGGDTAIPELKDYRCGRRPFRRLRNIKRVPPAPSQIAACIKVSFIVLYLLL
jgi:hypothetical protein